jgi:hypothetical protein
MTLSQQFAKLNKQYIALEVKQNEAAKNNNEDLYENLSYEMDIVQQQMSVLSAKIEANESIKA